MSDDEEVVNKGNELYTHLMTLGYTEFETFNSEEKSSGPEKSISCMTSSGSNTYTNETSPGSLDIIKLPFEAHKIVLNIIASKLLFIEDVEFLESLVFNSAVQKYWSIYNQIIIGTLSLSFASWAICLKIDTSIQLPLYLSGFCSLISLWYCRKGYWAKKEQQLLNNHIESLKQLCICIQKTFRFLKETEILATEQVSAQNVNSAMYFKTTYNSKDLKELPSWKTLPLLRKSLVDTLNQTIDILLLSSESCSQFLPGWLTIRQRFNKNTLIQENIENFEDYDASDTVSHISIRNLQSLIELYLDIQSEYLKIIASCLFPQKLFESDSMGLLKKLKFKYSSRSKTDFFEIISIAQSKIKQFFIQLKLEQEIQSKFSRSTKGLHSFTTKTDSTQKNVNLYNDIQVQLHDIFLRLQLMMLRIRSLEDVLEDLNNKDLGMKEHETFNESLLNQLNSVRNDFQSTIKEFDGVCCNIMPQRTSEITLSFPETIGEEHSRQKLGPISTGILLGKSDFSVNDSDEFFLASAGSSTECGENMIDEYGTESVAKMPKSLISELSTTLKSIRKEFKVRERLALQRLSKDVIDLFSSDDEEDCGKISVKKMKRTALDCKGNCEKKPFEEHDENFGDNKNTPHVVPTNIGDSYHQRILDETSSIPSVITDTSLANLVAMKSKMWGNQSEECFTDE